PAQVRLLGATGAGGATMTSKVSCLNDGAWAALVQDPAQVAAFTAPEIPTLQPAKIVALGTNIKSLSDAALGALTPNNSGTTGQIAALTAAQVMALSPQQIGVIAGIANNTGIS